MPYDTEKLVKLSALKTLAEKVNTDYTTKKELKDVSDKVPTNVSDLTNDAGYQKASDVEEAIKAKISSVYKPGGSVAFDALPELTEENCGKVVNVTDGFTTTDSFLEGAGKTYPAGTNVAVVTTDGGYKYDVQAGFVDLSGYQPKETGKGLSTNDYTKDDKSKLAGIAAGATKVEKGSTNGSVKINGVDTSIYELPTTVLQDANIADDSDVQSMLDEVFGTSD